MQCPFSLVLHTRFFIGNTIIYLEWLVERATGIWFVTSGMALGNNTTPIEQKCGSEVNDRR
jgi:hypothetical protein